LQSATKNALLANAVHAPFP